MPQFLTNPQLSGNAGSTDDPFRRKIVEALNAAGIPTHGARDDQLLSAYNALLREPIEQRLAAVNARLANAGTGLRTHADTMEEGDLLRLISSVKSLVLGASVDAMKTIGTARLTDIETLLKKEKEAPRKSFGNGSAADDSFAGYSVNDSLRQAFAMDRE